MQIAAAEILPACFEYRAIDPCPPIESSYPSFRISFVIDLYIYIYIELYILVNINWVVENDRGKI